MAGTPPPSEDQPRPIETPGLRTGYRGEGPAHPPGRRTPPDPKGLTLVVGQGGLHRPTGRLYFPPGQARPRAECVQGSLTRGVGAGQGPAP